MSELLTAILTLASVVSTVLAIHFHHRLIDTEKRVGQLEAAQVKHLPYRTADEIENSIAAILYMKQDADRKAELIENALNHLQLARGNGKRN